MRLLLDENLDWRLRRDLPGHQVESVPLIGWAGIENGELLTKATSSGARHKEVGIKKEEGGRPTLLALFYRFLYPKKPRRRMISATCGGTIWSQVSSPAAMRLSTSREKIGRYLGL